MSVKCVLVLVGIVTLSSSNCNYVIYNGEVVAANTCQVQFGETGVVSGEFACINNGSAVEFRLYKNQTDCIGKDYEILKVINNTVMSYHNLFF